MLVFEESGLSLLSASTLNLYRFLYNALSKDYVHTCALYVAQPKCHDHQLHSSPYLFDVTPTMVFLYYIVLIQIHLANHFHSE